MSSATADPVSGEVNLPDDELIVLRHMVFARWIFLFLMIKPLGLYSFYCWMLIDSLLRYGTVPGLLVLILENRWLMVNLLILPGFLLTGLGFLAYCTFVESWTITSRSVTFFGSLRTKKIEFSDITSLHWWPFNRMILIRGNRTHIPLFLDAMSPTVRRLVIHRLHTAVPLERQHHWDRFHRRFGEPKN